MSKSLQQLIARLDQEKRAILAELLRPESEPIAIIGIGCRFPGDVNTPQAFWEFLKNGRHGIVEIPANRWDIDAFYDPDPTAGGKSYTRHGGFLPALGLFDADFFGISPREALRMDPQQRLLLETTWAALENAGQVAADLNGSQIGVFIGITNNLYIIRQTMAAASAINDPYASIGSDCSAAAGRISYTFGFQGPTLSIDTACSSSLVALHLACQSLRSQECHLAVVGGVHAITVPQTLISGCHMGLLAVDGRCKTFDARADGFGLGEGCGIIICKRLQDALAAKDNIIAVIRGSAVNEDGRSNGLTAPNGLAQQAVIRTALKNANVAPHEVSYVEAHGAGTALGDPIEMESIRTVLASSRSPQHPLFIATVKTNVGHLYAAAGIAGVIKTALALQHRAIPPHLHLQSMNPNIDWDEERLRIPSTLTPWTPIAERRVAGVSSFSWSGINAHAILEEAPPILSTPGALSRPYHILPLSAKTEASLDAATTNLKQHLQTQPEINMARVAYTLQRGRQAFNYRRVLVCQDQNDGVQLLSGSDPSRVFDHLRSTQKQHITFMFPGVGDHYVNMARELYQQEAVFRQAVDDSCDLLQPLLGLDLRQLLYPTGPLPNAPAQGIDLRQMLKRDGGSHTAVDAPLYQTEIAQPAVFIIGYALAQLLQSWGITPHSLIGYSLGEYIAACVAGVFSLDDALMLVARRAQLIQTLPEGRMLAVSLSESEVQPFLHEAVCLAAVNGANNCVLAGPPTQLKHLALELANEEISYRYLETSHAFHSRMMAPITAEFTRLVGTVQRNRPQIRYLSNVTGNWITNEEATDPAYWARHLCQTVRFYDGLAHLLADEANILLEVGPGQSLNSFAKQHPRCRPTQIAHILPTLPYGYNRRSDLAFLLNTIGRLWLTGYPVDWDKVAGEAKPQRIPLPTYPFQPQDYWIDLPANATLQLPNHQQNANGKADMASWFYFPEWQETALPDTGKEIATHWLIFEDETGWGSRLGDYLKQQGGAVVRVRAGQGFDHQPGSERFTIRPHKRADYRALFDLLVRSGPIPGQIVHLWSLDETSPYWGFYSLLYLAQTLGAQSITQPVQITAVTHEMQPVTEAPVNPDHATLIGLCRVIPQEYPHMRCRLLDLSVPASAHNGAAPFTRQLTAELTTATTEAMVAYRAGKRYTQKFVQRPLPATAPLLRSDGVYLITGGLGSIGLLLAEYLAQQVQARLVLTSRSGLPPRQTWSGWLATHNDDDPTSYKIQKVQALEAAGAQVLIMAADVSDETAMQAVVDQIHEQFGALHGVIHGAGLTGRDSFKGIQELDQTLCEMHFRPKVYGLHVLDNVLAGEDLDFCLVLSSLSAVLGGLGFAAYAAANAYMDIYVQAHHRRTPHSPWRTINWDLWQSDTTSTLTEIVGTTLSEFAMTPAEGVQAFALALSTDAPHLVNSTGDLDKRIQQWVTLEALATRPTPNKVAFSRPTLTTAYTPANTEYEKRLAGLWQEALGLDQIGIHDNFFDLGGNSLIGLQLITWIQKEFNTPVSSVALFEAPTISALAKYLQPSITEQVDTRKQTLIKRRRRARRQTTDQAIAIIGMAGRFPGANSVAQLWQNLCNGVESITFFADDELLAAGIDPELINNPDYVKAHPIIDGIELFDATLFGYTPRDASLLDPQHRLFLEIAWEALDLAGYNNPATYPGKIGVFAGSSLNTYMLSWFADPQLVQSINNSQLVASSDKDSLTTTVSYKLDLKGPSLAVQTFCSTSLVATHLARQSLLNGECDIALAGGVSLMVPQKQGYLYQEGGQESPDGHCRPFDAQARGTLFGDGVGAVVLKRLDDALEDGDTIHAVIKSSAINNDGAMKVGYAAPSVVGQTEAVAMALDEGAVDPETIGYVEAHGSATVLGDPIEMRALSQAFAPYTGKTNYCAVGSVKSNIGHLDRAAGVTGLIKAALVVKHGLIPPSLHFETPNPEINFDDSPFYVNTVLSPWPFDNGIPRYAGVNSLGMGGTNAHVILEEPPAPPPSAPSRPYQLLLLSANTETALTTITNDLVDYLQQHPDLSLADVAYTWQMGRRTLAHRRMVVCSDIPDALAALQSLDSRRVSTHHQPDATRGIAFMFSGVGDHYLHMAQALYEQEPFFRDIVEQCCAILQPYLGTRLRDLLYPADQEHNLSEPGRNGTNLRAMLDRTARPLSPAAAKLRETAVSQPLIFVIEYALAQLLAAWGIRPQALIGYSLGEYVAACIAGVLSLPDALHLVAERAQLVQSLAPGRMVAVSLSLAEVRPFLSEEISLAVHSGETTCILAGSQTAVTALETRLAENSVTYRPLPVTHAIHSNLMLPLVAQWREKLKAVPLQPPRIPYLSNVTGTWITPEEATSPDYWVQQMCQTVRFHDGLAKLLKDKEQILLEIGPGQTLGSFARQHPACTQAQSSLILPTLPAVYEHRNSHAFLLETIGKLWLLDIKPDWSRFYANEKRRRIPLPAYPFERRRYWLQTERQVAATDRPADTVTALGRRPLADWFYLPTWQQTAPLTAVPPPPDTVWLLFVDEAGLGTTLAGWLTSQQQQVITVKPGHAFDRQAPYAYTVSPPQRADYEALLADLQQQNVKPTHIVHLWTVDGAPHDSLEKTLDRGFYSLIGLMQALNEHVSEDCAISVVSTGMQTVTSQETIAPAKATLLGPCRTIPLEYDHITCRSIDVSLPAAGRGHAEALQRNLLGELTADVTESAVALRGHHRWVQTFTPTPIPESAACPLRPQGVYLITGGLGGVGSAIAAHLAREVQARLVLVGRSTLPPRSQWPHILAAAEDANGRLHGDGRKIHQILQLEATGAEVLALSADVASKQHMEAVIQQTLHQFGAIHGVIHAAGVPGEGLMQFKTAEMATAVLAPKVMGTLVLDQLLQEVDLDFLALFSSISSFTAGGPGQVDYCAANAFLDAYAQSCARLPRLTTAINWSEWKWNAWEAGMEGLSAEVQDFFRQSREKFGIQFDEGGQAFSRVLSRRLPQMIVCTQDFLPLVQSSKRFTLDYLLAQGNPTPASGQRHPRPALGTPYEAPGTDMERKIAFVWSELLGIDKIGIHDNFFELGGNSLIGLDLVARLQKELHMEKIPAHTLYEAPTVHALALVLSHSQHHADLVAAQNIRGQKRRQQSAKRKRNMRARG